MRKPAPSVALTNEWPMIAFTESPAVSWLRRAAPIARRLNEESCNDSTPGSGGIEMGEGRT